MAIPIAIPGPTNHSCAAGKRSVQHPDLLFEMSMLTMTSGLIYFVPVLHIYTLGTAVVRSTLRGPSPVGQSGRGSRLIALAEVCKSLRLPGETDGSAEVYISST